MFVPVSDLGLERVIVSERPPSRVELGYLGADGHIVVADTLGHKVRFPAYRIDEAQKAFELFSKKRPMEALGGVTATVFLHRNGWSGPGEIVLQRSRTRLYRAKTSHLLVGGPWTALSCLHERDEPFTYGPYLSGGKQEPLKLTKDSRFFVLIEDISVRGVRQDRTTVEIFATERKQFLDFILGKLRMVVEFSDDATAANFASNFLAAQDVKALDDFTVVDISRSTEIVKPATAPGTKSTADVYYRREVVDMRSKWPALAWSRWAENVPGHAAAFAIGLKQLDVQSDSARIDLEGLDRFLRGLPPDTVFAAFVMDAAAYVGVAFLETLGVRTRYRWTTVEHQPPQPGYVLFFDEVNHFVSPVVWICKIWETKVLTTLHANVAQWTFEVRNLLAFRARAEFAAMGFMGTVRDGFKAFKDRVTEEALKASATSQILGERHLESRVLPFGEFEVYYVTGEVVEPTGSRYLPVMAVPFTRHTQTWTGSLDGASPRSPTREDVVIVRLEGNELVPLGIQLANYPELGPSSAERHGPLTLRAIAVADKGQILTPRVRQARPEIKDFLAPLDGTETGVPLSPYASVVGSIETVAETVNPMTNLPLWRLRLNVSSFRCEVLVRKDRCDGIPSPGNYFTGRVWLAARMEPESMRTDSYIR